MKRIKATAPPVGLLTLRFSGFVCRTAVETPPVSQLVLAPVWRLITVPSDVASRPPSEENASAAAVVSTPEVGGPAKARRSRPSFALHSATSPISDEAVASTPPAGENATASIRPSGDARCATSVQPAVAMRRTVPAPVTAARRSPPGETVTLQLPSGPTVPHRVYACPAAAGASVSGAANAKAPQTPAARAAGDSAVPARPPAPTGDAFPAVADGVRAAALSVLPAAPAALPFPPSLVSAPPRQPPTAIAATAASTFVACPIHPPSKTVVSKLSGANPATRGRRIRDSPPAQLQIQ